jgi:hypothetical protein
MSFDAGTGAVLRERGCAFLHFVQVPPAGVFSPRRWSGGGNGGAWSAERAVFTRDIVHKTLNLHDSACGN